MEIGRNYESLRLTGDAKLTLAALNRAIAAKDGSAIDGATQGTGPGPSIVEEVAQRHGADLDLTDGLPSPCGTRGLSVRLTFKTQSGLLVSAL